MISITKIHVNYNNFATYNFYAISVIEPSKACTCLFAKISVEIFGKYILLIGQYYFDYLPIWIILSWRQLVVG